MKTIKLIFGILALITIMFTMPSCSVVTVESGEVAVLNDKPLLFGTGGVRSESWGPGRYYTWISTSHEKYQTIPVNYEEHFENIITADNNPVNFSAYIKISVKSDSAWYLDKKFLKEWYKNNIQPKFRTKVRDKSCPHKMFDLTTKREISVQMENELKDEMIIYCNGIKIPVIIEEVNIGSVQPQPSVLEAIALTAATVQNQKTQDAESDLQDRRKIAEEKRAISDMAYKNKMGLTNEQFVTLKYIEMLGNSSGSTFVVGEIPGMTINRK